MPTKELSNVTRKYVDGADVTLKEHLETRIEGLEKSLDERFRSQEKALITALQANEKRLDSMNEFRETLRDQNKTFITKQDHDTLIISYQKDIDNLNDKINTLNEFRAELKGKASQSQFNITLAFSILSLMLGIIGIILGFFGK